jgi:hypothetical protein
MKANSLAKDYHRLTAEERFRLILAASGRGDEVEQERLIRASERITLSVPDHTPFVRAFDEVALLTFIELLEAASIHHDALQWSSETAPLSEDDADEEHDDTDPDGDSAEAKTDPNAGVEPDEADGADAADDDPDWEKHLDVALAAAFVLRTKAAGWQLFCARLHLPPFAWWQVLPGWERLQRALASAERVAFQPEGFLRWVNQVPPAREPERTDVALTAEAVADAIEKTFRQRVSKWGG